MGSYRSYRLKWQSRWLRSGRYFHSRRISHGRRCRERRKDCCNGRVFHPGKIRIAFNSKCFYSRSYRLCSNSFYSRKIETRLTFGQMKAALRNLEQR